MTTSFYLIRHLPTEPLLWRKCKVRQSFNDIHSFLSLLADIPVWFSDIAKLDCKKHNLLQIKCWISRSFMLMESGIDNKRRQRRKKNIPPPSLQLFNLLVTYLLQILIWCNQTFPYLHFCFCSSERWLATKEKYIIVWCFLKGHLSTKMHWLHFSLQEEKVTFVMSGDDGVAVKCQDVPGWTLQCYRYMDQWYIEDVWPYSASVCGWNHWPGKRSTLAEDPWAEMGNWKTDMKRWAQSPFGPGGPIVLFIEGDLNGT